MMKIYNVRQGGGWFLRYVAVVTNIISRGIFKVFVLFISVLATALPAQSNEKSPALDNLIQEVFANNQDLLSMEENAMALLAEAPFAGSLQDPVVGIGLINLPTNSFDFDQEAMTQKQLFVSQKFPWFGTLDLRQQASELKAMKADTVVRTKRFELAKKVAEAWYDLGYLQKQLDVNESLKTIVSQTLRIAETRYATGSGLQQDIFAGQVQLSELIDEAISLKSREETIRASIARLLNRVDGFYEPGPLVIESPAEQLSSEALIAVALQSNPALQGRQLAVDQAKIEVLLAKKAYLPDFDLRLSYGQREDDPTNGNDRADLVSAVVAMTVPLWQSTRQDSKLSAVEKRLLAAEKSFLGLKNTLPHSISSLLSEIKSAQENYRLYRDVLTVQAANLADGALAAYSVGKIEFDTMLSARVRLLRVGLKAEGYLYQIYKKMIQLEEIVGRSLSSLEEIK